MKQDTLTWKHHSSSIQSNKLPTLFSSLHHNHTDCPGVTFHMNFKWCHVTAEEPTIVLHSVCKIKSIFLHSPLFCPQLHSAFHQLLSFSQIILKIKAAHIKNN